MHVVGLEKVFAVNSRFLELRDFLHVLGVFKLDLGDQVLEVSHLRRRLLCFQFGDQVFQFIYPLDKLLRVLRDLVHENGVLLHLSLETTRLIWPKTLKIGQLDFHFVILEEEILILLMNILILRNQGILLLVDNFNLLNKEFGGSTFVVLGLLPGEALISFE